MGRTSKEKRDRRGRYRYPHLESWPPLEWWHCESNIGTERQMHRRGIDPVFSPAVHQPSGMPFLLASVPDGPILAMSPLSQAADAFGLEMMVLEAAHTYHCPVCWANRQPWRVVPGYLVRTPGAETGWAVRATMPPAGRPT
jgi:hypothetical protein